MINGMGLITGLIIGALAGWIAGKFMDNDGSLLTNIILGLVGGFVGNLVLGFVGIHGSGLIGNLIVAICCIADVLYCAFHISLYSELAVDILELIKSLLYQTIFGNAPSHDGADNDKQQDDGNKENQ